VIGYLEGTLRQLDATRALLVAGGVGYEIHISLSTYYRLEGKRDAALDIYTHVREDTLALYGFATAEEKLAFEKLISISGIGPTVAQKILSGIDVADLADAVARDDVRKLSSIPGVGKKTAERLVVELKDKMQDLPSSEAAPVGPSAASDDVVSALVHLGYARPEAERAVERTLRAHANAPFEDLLRFALQAVSRRP